MLLYIALFIILTFLFGFFLLSIFFIKCLGLVPIAKKIITKLFSSQYDKKYQDNYQQPINIQCYICLENSKCEVVTTCNHSFCSQCILDFIESKRQTQINCPACRKQIFVLCRRFQPRNTHQRQLKVKIAEYNCSNSKQIGFFRSILEFTNIIKHIGVLFSAEGLKYMLDNPRMKNILILLVYTLSPVDLLPEMMLGPLGLIDDTYASLQLLRQFSNLWIEFIRDQSHRIQQRDR